MKTILFALITAAAIATSVAMASTANPDPTPPKTPATPTERMACFRHRQAGVTKYVECETCCVEVRTPDGTWIRFLCGPPNCSSEGLPPVVVN